MPINHKKIYALEETPTRCGVTVIDGLSPTILSCRFVGVTHNRRNIRCGAPGRKMLWHTEMCQPSQATVDDSPTQGCSVLALEMVAL